MKEPSWDHVDERYSNPRRGVHKGDLVWVVSRTRGRFGSLEKATPGVHGVVISKWSSSMGTPKICILCEDGEERATTQSCARTFNTMDDFRSGHCRRKDAPDWVATLNNWMERTYVPIIVQREPGYGRSKWAQSRDKTAYLVKALNTKSKIWLNRGKVHPADWDAMTTSDSRCVSVRVPVWVAKKSGLFADDANSK